MNVEKLVKTQRIFFEKNITKNVEFRKKALKDSYVLAFQKHQWQTLALIQSNNGLK